MEREWEGKPPVKGPRGLSLCLSLAVLPFFITFFELQVQGLLAMFALELSSRWN